MSTMTKSTEPNKYPWTKAERERWWRAEKEEGQIVRVRLPVLGPCMASGNVTVTGLDRE